MMSSVNNVSRREREKEGRRNEKQGARKEIRKDGEIKERRLKGNKAVKEGGWKEKGK